MELHNVGAAALSANDFRGIAVDQMLEEIPTFPAFIFK
jgi:hypothetical protein